MPDEHLPLRQCLLASERHHEAVTTGARLRLRRRIADRGGSEAAPKREAIDPATPPERGSPDDIGAY
jgi:hypothetical protein